jgi:hypothetical protein
MGGANHFDIGVDEEERYDLTVPRFRGVGELEWAHTVLQDVGESEQASLESLDASDLLYSLAFVLASIHLGEPFVMALRVVTVVCLVNELAEGDRRGSDDLARVIIDGSGDDSDVFILHVHKCEDMCKCWSNIESYHLTPQHAMSLLRIPVFPVSAQCSPA